MKAKRFKVYLLLIVLLLSIQSTSFASEPPSTIDDLEYIASNMITLTISTDSNGCIHRAYKNIDSFISYVQENTSISDYDLAVYIMNYTGLDYNEYTPEAIVLETLTFLEITVIDEFISIESDEELETQGVAPCDNWVSSDGHLKITTTYSKTTIAGEDRYVVSAKAEWLNVPTIQLSDVFVLASNATFDSTYTEYAYFKQEEYCVTHDHPLHRFTSVTKNNPYGTGITLEYSAGFPGINFDYFYLCDIDPTAYQYDPNQTVIEAFIRYRVIPTVAGGTYSVQASYCHKTVGVGDISWSLGPGGLQPSFSFFGFSDEHFARPVTLL